MIGKHLVVGCDDGSIYVCDWSTGEEMRHWQGYVGERGWFSLDMTALICCGWEERIFRKWDVQTGQLMNEFSAHDADITRLVATNGDIVVYKKNDDTLVSISLSTGMQFGKPLPSVGVTALAVSDVVATGSADGTVRLWDLFDGELIADPMRGHQSSVTALAVSQQLVLSGSTDGTVRIWNRNAIPVGRSSPHSAAQFPYSFLTCVVTNGDLVLLSCVDGTIRVLDATTGKTVTELQSSAATSRSRSPSPRDSIATSDTLVFFGGRHGVSTWDRITRDPVFPPVSNYKSGIQSIAISGKLLLTVDDAGGLRLWDSLPGGPIDSHGMPQAAAAQVAANEHAMLIAHQNGWLQLLKTPGPPDGQLFNLFNSPWEIGPYHTLAVSDDFVAAASPDGEVVVWDRNEGRVIPEIPRLRRDPPMDSVNYATPISITRNLIAVGTGLGVALWDTKTRRSIEHIRLGSPVNSIATKDSSIFVGCHSGLLRIDLG